MNAILSHISTFVVTLSVCFGLYFLLPKPSGIIVATSPTVERIKNLKEICSLRLTVSNAMMAKNVWFMGTPFEFGSKMMLIVNGSAILSTDMEGVVILNKDDLQKCASIQLKSPRVIAATVDHKTTRIYDNSAVSPIGVPIFSEGKDKLYETAMLEAQKSIEEVASRPERIQQAKVQAEAAIKFIYDQIGWKVNIEWV